MIIKTSDNNLIKTFFKKLSLPQPNSHKGQNGKILIIGGSSLFHSASLWAAEVVSHFADMVHYSSTVENEEIFLSLKKKFHNGMVISQNKLMDYVKEDDTVLVGPGMMREGKEGKYTYNLTKTLVEKFPNKKFVFDAGALQMIEVDWLKNLKQKAVITPHQKEFEKLFGININIMTIKDKEKIVKTKAKEFKTVILLKAVVDIISDGDNTMIIEGGNAGLTKGGTGDVLASLTSSFYLNNNCFDSAVFASILLKKTSEVLYRTKGYWYNVSDIIDKLPEILCELTIK